MGVRKSRSEKSRGFWYSGWVIVGLAIGFGLKYEDELQRHARSVRESTNRWLASLEQSRSQMWSSHPLASPPTNLASEKPATPPATSVPNNRLQKNTDSPAFVELVLRPGENGHFFTTVQINGHSVKVMVDTGASFVSIPANLQAELELPLGRPMTFTTASDKYISHETTIRHLVLGPILLQNIAGDLNPRSPDGKILLGMSALKHLEMVHKNATLTLRAPRFMAVTNSPSQSNAAGEAKELLTIKRPVRECMGTGKMIDQKALECIKGN